MGRRERRRRPYKKGKRALKIIIPIFSVIAICVLLYFVSVTYVQQPGTVIAGIMNRTSFFALDIRGEIHDVLIENPPMESLVSPTATIIEKVDYNPTFLRIINEARDDREYVVV